MTFVLLRYFQKKYKIIIYTLYKLKYILLQILK